MTLEQKGSKKIKIEKPVELDPEDSEEEEGGTCRRRLGRLVKSQARYKQKAKRYRVEEVEEDNSENNEKEVEEEQ